VDAARNPEAQREQAVGNEIVATALFEKHGQWLKIFNFP
jgi:hypothetical protein